MYGPSEFEIFIAYPPDREGRVAQLIVRHGGVAETVAEVYRDSDLTVIQLFPKPDGGPSTYRATEFASAVEAAVVAVETSVTYSVVLRAGQATEQRADGLDSDELDQWLSSNGDEGDPFVYSWTPPGHDVPTAGEGAMTSDGPAYRLRS